MFTDNDEAAYIQRRITTSLGMARAATSDCARIAHEALVEGYGRNLAALKHLPHGQPSPESAAHTGAEDMHLEPLPSTC